MAQKPCEILWSPSERFFWSSPLCSRCRETNLCSYLRGTELKTPVRRSSSVLYNSLKSGNHLLFIR